MRVHLGLSRQGCLLQWRGKECSSHTSSVGGHRPSLTARLCQTCDNSVPPPFTYVAWRSLKRPYSDSAWRSPSSWVDHKSFTRYGEPMRNRLVVVGALLATLVMLCTVLVTTAQSPAGAQGPSLWAPVGVGMSPDGVGEFGQSVSMSADGQVVAIGSPNDGLDFPSQVRVMNVSTDTWTPIGSVITASPGDKLGWSVSLAADGERLALGVEPDAARRFVRVLDWDGGAWVQVGEPILALQDWFGHQRLAVSLSADGSRVAIGEEVHDGFAGAVRVFELQEGGWVQVGETITNPAIVELGQSVALNDDGSRVAIGAEPGAVVYDFDGSAWAQLGAALPINQPVAGWRITSVAISADGSKVAAIGLGSYAQVHEFAGGAWNQVGADLPGGGDSVDLSDDGSRVALGGLGKVQVFDLVGGAWDQVGPDVPSILVPLDTGQPVFDVSGAQFGASVSMSADGSRFVGGDPAYGYDFSSGDRARLGHVRVFEEFPAGMCEGFVVTMDMNRGPLHPSRGDDVIMGSPGDDFMWGSDGDDVFCGGDGNDEIWGQDGADQVWAGDGDDQVDGGRGDDWISGDPGADKLFGRAGNDRLLGTSGDDEIEGGVGNDTLHGNRGEDVLDGGPGNDRIYGYAHDDEIFGGEGDDRLHGNFGNDVIDGGPGDDRIFGYGDNDQLDGGDGNDLIGGNRGDDVIDGGDGNDTLYGSDGNDTVSGGAGNDDVSGNSLDDIVSGGSGNDKLDGGIGTDTCSGGTGSDTASRCETTTGVP